MATPPYVFISYSRQDLEPVGRIVERLNDAGVRVWRDLDQIAPGERWADSIARALEGASAFIYVASGNSVKSAWMNHEFLTVVERKGDKRTPIIPVILDSAGANNLPKQLQTYQWIDLRTNFDTGIDELTRALLKFLPAKSPISKSAQRTKGYAFLSYVEEDFDFVKGLRQFLENRGYSYWDFRESQRNYQVQFFLELEGIIKEASATLCVLSPAWKQSSWTTKEYFFSEEVGTPVFLLRAKVIEPTLLISGLPYIDFAQNGERGFERLDRELSRRGL